MTSRITDETPVPRASNQLLKAALCGLLAASAFVACSDDKTEEGVAPEEDSGAPNGSAGNGGEGNQPDSGTPPEVDSGAGSVDAGNGADASDFYEIILSEGDEITLAEFQAMCDDRNGWVYATAYCAGSALCKGLSLGPDYVLTDHSCKGVNSCGGIGCVTDLPADTGLSGQEIYENGPCGNCHWDWADFDNPNSEVYTVVHGPEISGPAAVARFENSSDERLISIVMFGINGVHESGLAYSSMPDYFKTYSRAEIERVVEYVRSLPTLAAEYEIPGYVSAADPDAGADAGDGG
jgi:hypothetical protein